MKEINKFRDNVIKSELADIWNSLGHPFTIEDFDIRHTSPKDVDVYRYYLGNHKVLTILETYAGLYTLRFYREDKKYTEYLFDKYEY